MGMKHIKDCMRVCQRAGVNVFVIGAHGTGKTTGIQQLWLEEAIRRHGSPDALTELSRSIGGDVRALSTIDARLVANMYQDLDQYRFCQVSVPNLTLEEMVGMPHVVDHDRRRADAYVASHQIAAATGADRQAVFADMCRDLGIRASGGQELRYLRMGNLLPPTEHVGGGVLLADEMNRGQTEVAQAWMQLIISGTYLDYSLPRDFWIVTTMNPDDSEYQVRSLDPALLNRGAVFAYYPDVDEFLAWAKARGLAEHTRVFADKHRKLVNAREGAVAQIKTGATCTNRSLELLDRAWAVMEREEIDTLGSSIAAALLGPEAGALYHKEATDVLHRPIRAREIVEEYGWSPEMSRDEIRDFKSWKPTKVRTRLLGQVKKTNVKSELLKITLDELSDWVSQLDEDFKSRGVTGASGSGITDAEKGQILNVMLFLTDIPSDISRRFMLEELHGRYNRVMYWAGVYPVVRLLGERVGRNFEEALNDA
jgi:hypothetical protein